MEIESFVIKSEGDWIAMRSGHSLAFKQFEEVISEIKIRLLKFDDYQVKDLLEKTGYSNSDFSKPFKIEWSAQSDWDQSTKDQELHGCSIFIPIEQNNSTGIFLKSKGYAEKIQAISDYLFLDDGTLVLSTVYENMMAEERIWFLNHNVRCRASVVRSIDSNAILQTSFTSEVRKLVS